MLRDWTDSLRFDGISAEAERLFIRLIMKADDYGRFHADARLLKANCFPLIDNVRTNDLSRWLDELSTRQLILRYDVDGRNYLAIPNYGQRLKSSRAKFPPHPGYPVDWLPGSDFSPEVPGSSGNSRLEEKRREAEEEEEGKPNAPRAGAGGADLLSIIQIYPRRERQAECLEVIRKHIEQGVDASAIVSGTKAIAAAIQQIPGGHLNAYVPGALTFFRHKRWEDDPATWLRQATKANGSQTGAPPSPVSLGGRPGAQTTII